MKYKLLFIVSLAMLVSCKPNKSVSSVAPEQPAVQVQAHEVEPPVDTALICITRIISEELKARNLHFTIEENGSLPDSTIEYKYIFKGDKYTSLRLVVRQFDCDTLARQYMAELKDEKQQKLQNDELVKISARWFRGGNKVYSVWCTANIEHIVGKSYTRSTTEIGIKGDDKEIY